MKTKFLVLCTFITFFAHAQNNLFWESYTWNDQPDYDTSSLEGDIAGLKDINVVEFAYGPSGGLEEYYLEHQVIWLNSDESIEENNKLYLPHASTAEILLTKARVISPSGKIENLGDASILEAKDEESGRKYKYFAFEGIGKGSIIEYLYAVKRNPDYNGKRYFMQSEYPKQDLNFKLITPENLIFKMKTYNALPEVSESKLEERNLYEVSAEHIEGLDIEDASAFNARRGFLIYKLDANTANNGSRISSYENVAKNLYSFYHKPLSNKENKLLENFLKEAIGKDKTGEGAIRDLERYIKLNVYKSNGNSSELKMLEEVLSKKVANTTGLNKLYFSSLRYLGFDYEIVLTSDRTQIKFDKDFEAHNFLTELLLYFPEYNTYLSPSDDNSRYGYPSGTVTDNYGLFIKGIKVGDFETAISEIKYIDPVPADKTIDRMELDVTFDPDQLTSNKIAYHRSFGGYYALSLQPYLHLIKKDDLDDILESFAKNMNESITIEEKKILDPDPGKFGIAPMEFAFQIRSDAFVEKAGNKLFFKLGELIGRQVEMYQEKERVMPYENDYTRSYYRTIRVEIPEGYAVRNLEDIKINNSYSADGIRLMAFESLYSLEGNTLVVEANEFYNINLIEPEIFEEFREIINSAADFNRVTLILEPES